ncbi:MAG: hypothetical protein H0W70_11350 [Actinobacteria bacterium]|nr:hypothetical protein [Actinomycetota bacterium]
MSDRFVVLGLATARARWFAAFGQWAHAGSLPVDFVKCVSVEQLRVRLRSGRLHSAALIDGSVPALDRDLIESVHGAGATVIVVDAATRHPHWTALGADHTLADGFGPSEITDALRTHAAMVPTGEWDAPRCDHTDTAPAHAPLVVLCGPGGTGVSTLAIAFAQQWAAERSRPPGEVLLADLCLRAEQAMLHDAGDVGPGIQELVDQCRTANIDRDQARSHAYAVPERGYALLLGLRQPEAWSALRPRAIGAALASLQTAFSAVVCDCDADLEGQAQGGSVDVEERNALARSAVTRADAVFVVGAPGLKGTYSLARVIAAVADAGAAPARVVPVFNRASRSPRARARLNAALAALLPDSVRHDLAPAVFIPERDVEMCLHDRTKVPAALGDPLVGAFRAVDADAAQAVVGHQPQARRLRAGELRGWSTEVTA